MTQQPQWKVRDGANAAGRAGGRIPGGRSRPGGFTVLRKFLRIMNATCRRFGLPLLAGVLLTAASVLPAQADVTRTQTLPLRRGWNAVWLEVIPSNPDPATVFAGLPVSIAATYLRAITSVQFIKDPAVIGWKKEGWGVWYAPGRPDGFLSTLFAIDGNRPYLLYAEQECVWQITGCVALEPVRWKNDSFNLVGFGLDPESPPTFEKFFASSPAHRHYRIYRLANDRWERVINPTNSVMRAGEACWVHCRGVSDYQGPLRVTLPTHEQIVFGARAEAPIVLANESGDPASVRLETASTDAGLPLAYILRGITAGQMDDLTLDLPAVHQLPTLEAGKKTSVRLKVRRERMGAGGANYFAQAQQRRRGAALGAGAGAPGRSPGNSQ